MNPSNFDELTKGLANSTSRRDALRIITTASLGGLFGLVGIRSVFATGNSNCAKWCAQVFGPNTPAAGKCASDAAHKKGPCFTCGNVSPSSICCVRNTSGYCNGSVVVGCSCNSSQCQTCNISTGTCGNACPSGQTCCSGGHCKDLSNDVNNCGTCGNACLSGQTCQSGTCVSQCVPNCLIFGKVCGDDGCGGSCGTCTSGQSCVNGSCCDNAGTTCSGDSDCCSNSCCSGTCCSSGICCGTNPAVCCGGFTICQNNNCCLPDNFECSLDSDCCSGNCLFIPVDNHGVCIPA